MNWRPQLVGAIATYFRPTDGAIVQMWAALDSGSFVAPQLVGVLSKVDTDFVSNATARLVASCPLSANQEYSIESPIERHSAQGPAGSRQRSSKSAASLLALLPSAQAAEFSANENLQPLVADDYDGSAEIATSWIGKLRELEAQL